MDKKTVVALIALYLLSFTGRVFSQDQVYPPQRKDFDDYVAPGMAAGTKDAAEEDGNFDILRGRIISIDRQKNQVVIEEDETLMSKTIEVPPARLQYLSIGNHVKVRIRPGGNKAENIRKIGSWHPSAARSQ